MYDEDARANGWRCPACERKNPPDGDGRCQTPGCKGAHRQLLRKQEEFPPDA
jgi:hypothetical protein